MLLICATSILHGQSVVRDTIQFENNISISPKELLRGKVSGVRVSATDGNFNDAINVTIRGINSFRGDSEPLWIIDGAYMSNSIRQNSNAFWQYEHEGYTSTVNQFAFLAPQDIESIEIIKDISATARYGANGANGVVIINTRNAGNRELEVGWTSNMGISIPSHGFGHASVSHNHNVGVSGSNNRNSYRVSLNLRDNNGTIPRQNNLFGGMSVNFDSKSNKSIWFGLNSYLSAGRMENPSGTAWYGSPSAMLAYRGIGSTSVKDWTAGYDDESTDFRTLNTAYLTINFLPQFYWETRLGLDFENNTRYVWYGNETPFGKANKGAAAILSSAMFSYNATSRFAYHLYIGQNHGLDFSAGVEVNGNIDKFNNMNGNHIVTHKLRARGLSFAESKAEIHKFNRRYFHLGVYGRISYSYMKVIGADLMFRGDNTARYDDSDFIHYPSANAYIDIHRLAFPQLKAVSSLRIEGGWGIAGRETFVPYEMFGAYSPGGYINVPEDIAIVYEGLDRLTSNEWNIGMSAGFLSQRIKVGAKFYTKYTDDTLYTYCFGEENQTTGRWKFSDRSLAAKQSGKIRNRGLEFNIGADVIRTSAVCWSIDANISFCSNQVTSLDRRDETCGDVAPGMKANINVTGYGIGTIYGYQTDEFLNYVDQTGDGKIREEDKILLGQSQPNCFGGLGTSLSMYGFTLEADIDGAAGNKVLNMNRMIKDGAEAVSDIYVEDASFLRIGRIALSYNIPTGKVRWLKGARVFLSAENPVVFSAYSGLNPDVDSFGSSNFTRGIDYGSFPLVRSIVLGFNFKF